MSNMEKYIKPEIETIYMDASEIMGTMIKSSNTTDTYFSPRHNSIGGGDTDMPQMNSSEMNANKQSGSLMWGD